MIDNSMLTDEQLRNKYELVLIGPKEKALIDWWRNNTPQTTDTEGYVPPAPAKWRENTISKYLIETIEREKSFSETRENIKTGKLKPNMHPTMT